MRRVLVYSLTLVILAALVAGGLALRHKRLQELADLAPPAPAPWALRVADVSRGRATQGFPALALVKGANEVAVAPRIAGIILEMGPREGQPVAAGDLLARIDTRELEDQIASLEAQYQGAIAEAERKERDADRTRDLLAQRSISESQADQQRSDARSARERVNSLKNQIAAERTRLDYARVTAPFDGVIAERLADPGSLAQVGAPLYRLVATDSGRLEVRLPAEVLEVVAPGTEVVLSHRGQTLDLRADRVFPSLDQRALGRLEIEVPELPFGLAPGALLRARVITKSVDDALLVPVDALLGGSDPAQATVFRVATGEPTALEALPVTIALRGATQAAVTGDLAPGDRVVTAHETTLRRLQAGDPVQIAETAP
jgi:membrane fusion protein, multidrug efflux system